MINTAAQLGSYAFNSILAAVVAIVVIRHLGRTEYGVMAFVVAYVSFFQILTSMGADTVIFREISRRPDQASNLIGGALSLRLFLSATTMLLAWATIPFVAANHRLTMLVILYSMTFLFSCSGLYSIVFNAELRSHIPNTAFGVLSLVYSGIRIGMVALGAGVVHFLAADVIAAAIGLLLIRWVAARYSSLRAVLRVDPSLWRVLLAEGWPVAMAVWLISLHWRIDQLLLFHWGGAEELGSYAVAVRLSEIWGVLGSAFVMSLFPLLSRDASADESRIERTSSLGYRYLYAVILPIALVLITYPRFLLGLLFGPAFVEAADALAILAVAEIFVFSNSLTYNILYSVNRQRKAALVAVVSLTANILMNLWLIPVAGATGAAVASLGSYASVPILTLLLPQIRWVGARALAGLSRPVMAAGLTACVLWLLSPDPIAGLLLVAVVYPAALVGVGGLGRGDLKLLVRVLSRK